MLLFKKLDKQAFQAMFAYILFLCHDISIAILWVLRHLE